MSPVGGSDILGIHFVGRNRLGGLLDSLPWRARERGLVICDSIDRAAPVADRNGDLRVIDLCSIDPRDGVTPSPELSP